MENYEQISQSMEFSSRDSCEAGADSSNYLIAPPRSLTFGPVQGEGPLPISQFSEVRSLSDSEFIIAHKTHEQMNIAVRVERGVDESDCEWVGLP